ncbi:DUF305 domain-containing protein [Microbacterium invictum]|uniref:DUF305 domain-containing protein n=1 Tax=Microbacterium invictum TaxID=515415 RepID=A0ABZ0V8Y6_9MICO|nr:DUF305 domain-containing protein [Microbacterium invictum]WQB69786.1 DUF305 domain-containing protein [Microbacterium invictum]
MNASRMRPLAGLAAAAALSIALVGCGSTSPGTEMGEHGGHGSASAEAGEMMSADAQFAMMMIPHHEQAVEMSDMLLEKDGIDEDVAALAERIRAAQGPEIEQMREWLDAQGISMGDMDDMDMGGMDHSGMMSEEDMDALEASEGAEASRLFLEQMIEHHEGAIEMAEDQVADGEDAEMVALAESIIASQTAEITEMQELLETV